MVYIGIVLSDICLEKCVVLRISLLTFTTFSQKAGLVISTSVGKTFIHCRVIAVSFKVSEDARIVSLYHDFQYSSSYSILLQLTLGQTRICTLGVDKGTLLFVALVQCLSWYFTSTYAWLLCSKDRGNSQEYSKEADEFHDDGK